MKGTQIAGQDNVATSTQRLLFVRERASAPGEFEVSCSLLPGFKMESPAPLVGGSRRTWQMFGDVPAAAATATAEVAPHTQNGKNNVKCSLI